MQYRQLLVVLIVALSGCVPTYKLVNPDSVAVAKGSMIVSTAIAWNKVPAYGSEIKTAESWTLNGPVLDLVTFIGGVNDGKALAKHQKKDDRQVPVFRSNMTPPELVAMIESYYRIKGGAAVFETTGVQPATFLGGKGMQVDFRYVSGDDVKRKGRSMVLVIGEKLYLMFLDAAELHYYDALLPEFEAMVQSAKIA